MFPSFNPKQRNIELTMFPTLTYYSNEEAAAYYWRIDELDIVRPGHLSVDEVRNQLVAYLNESYPEFKFVFRQFFGTYYLRVAKVKTPNKEYSVYDIYQKHPFSGYQTFKMALWRYFFTDLMKNHDQCQMRYSSVSIQGNKLVLS